MECRSTTIYFFVFSALLLSVPYFSHFFLSPILSNLFFFRSHFFVLLRSRQITYTHSSPPFPSSLSCASFPNVLPFHHPHGQQIPLPKPTTVATTTTTSHIPTYMCTRSLKMVQLKDSILSFRSSSSSPRFLLHIDDGGMDEADRLNSRIMHIIIRFRVGGAGSASATDFFASFLPSPPFHLPLLGLTDCDLTDGD